MGLIQVEGVLPSKKKTEEAALRVGNKEFNLDPDTLAQVALQPTSGACSTNNDSGFATMHFLVCCPSALGIRIRNKS